MNSRERAIDIILYYYLRLPKHFDCLQKCMDDSKVMAGELIDFFEEYLDKEIQQDLDLGVFVCERLKEELIGGNKR